jgi:putative ABC transport system permease protein
MDRNAPVDLVYAVRLMKTQPGFTAIVIATLAVGIGATTAVFGIINAALLSSLPFEEPERLVMGRATFGGTINPWASGYDYYDYRDQSRSFEHLSAFMFGGRVTIGGEAEPEVVDAAFGTWDLFHTLKIAPAAGRLFLPEEGVVDGPPVVMVSHAYWQRRLGGTPEAVGRPLTINGSPHTVVGVLPAGFHFMLDADVWRLTFRDGPGATARRWHNLLLIGRLRPNVSVHQAQAEMDTISGRLEQLYPDTNKGKALDVTDLHSAMVENLRPNLLMLMGAVALVLMLSCSNVAGLLLARGQNRLNEIALRSAIGASRRRLMRQLLTESTLLALLAGLSGVVLAVIFQGLLTRLLPLESLGMTGSTLGAPVLLFALGVSLATGILFGLVPALQGTVVDLSRQLSTGIRATWARGSSMFRNGFVVLQVAISVTLLIGAGLMIRSLILQMRVDPGFNPEQLMTAGVRLSESDYPTPEEKIAFFETLTEQIEALPGVRSIGLVNRLPIRNIGGNIYLYADEQAAEQGQSSFSRSADFRCVNSGYLETMGIPLLAGRGISDTDTQESPRVMVITASLADLFFPEQNPLGKKLIVDMGELVVHEVVGVVGNVRLRGLTRDPFHAMYMSYAQVAGSRMNLAIRTTTKPTTVVGPVRDVLKNMDPKIALADPMTMEAIIDSSLSDFRVITSSLGVLSLIALLLALVGLYGVLACYVGQRNHEIGVRMALGATARQVAHLVLSRGLLLVAVGLVAGLIMSFWATSLLQRLLFGVEAGDPVTFLTTALGFGLVAALACLVPAWQATRVNPVVTLKAE